MVKTVASLAALFDQMGAAEQAQVFGDCGAGNRKCLSDFAGRLASLPQQVEDCAAGGVRQCAEGRFRGICNRTVTHNA
jgi:hypothetical protein